MVCWRGILRLGFVASCALFLTGCAARGVGVERLRFVTPDARVADRLVRQLGDESYEAREAATDGLVALGPGLVPLLGAYKGRYAGDLEILARLEVVREGIGDKLAAAIQADGGNVGEKRRAASGGDFSEFWAEGDRR